MSEQNMKNVRRLLEEVWSEGNLSVLPEIMAEDVVAHPMQASEPLQGRDGYQHFIAVYKGAFLSQHFTLEEQFASGDKVTTRWTAYVTEDSPDSQHGPDGEPMSISGISVTHHGSDGKIVEGWDAWDTAILLRAAATPDIFEQLAIRI